ncbi:MAG: amino acid permease, partial [Candidatus Binatia bacterium]
AGSTSVRKIDPAGPARWADSRRSYHFQRIRENLLAAAMEPEHPRDWRPQLLAFSDDSCRRERLLRFASWLEGDSGLTTAVRILEGEGAKTLKLKEEAEEELRKSIAQHGLKAFPLVVAAPTLQVGIHTLVQAFGIGPLRANTILLNWLDQLPKGIFGLGELRYARNLREAFRFGCNIVVLDAKENEWANLQRLSPHERRIDVWWWGDATSRLILLLAYLMTRSEEWDGAKIRVLAADHEQASEATIEGLQRTLEEVRIEADPEIVEGANVDAIVENSADSALVFLPFRLRGNQLLGPFDNRLDDLIPRLPVVALVLAAEDIDLDAEPEEGKAGELAEALDTLADAKKRAHEAEKEAAEAAEEAEKKLQELESAIASGGDEDLMAKVKATLEAKERASKTSRRAAKALAKVENAAREAETLGAEPDKESGESEEPSNSEKGKDPSLP